MLRLTLIPAAALRRLLLPLLLAVLVGWPGSSSARPPASGKLEIHYIDVGQGGATLIIGPDGTTIFYDFGRVAGRKHIVPYLTDVVRFTAGDAIHYAMVSHGDKDHYMGYKDVVDAGIDVLKANFEPGTPKAPSSTMLSHWLEPAKKTKAGAFKAIPVGLRIFLGDGAEAFVVAANGVVLGETNSAKVKNENDRSIALFIRYGQFRYMLDGDLGAGPEACTGRDTGQIDVQSRVARALIANGLMSEADGVDVLHVSHHGSESSTSAAYYNLMKPKVALVSVGADQGTTFLHPRVDVVEKVLLQTQKVDCVTAPPVKALLQTGPGVAGCSSTGCTSFKGLPVGHIVVKTDGKANYTISVSKPPTSAVPHFSLGGAHPWKVELAPPAH